MRTSIILALPFAAVALAQATSDSAVSQISDGQPQATYTNGFTSYLTQTNSLGVVTGQPAPVTTQPTAVTSMAVAETSQTVAATFISGSPGIPDVPTTIATVSIPVVASSPPIVSGAAASSGFSTLPIGANTTVTTASSPSTSGSGSTASGSGSVSATGTRTSNPSGTAGAQTSSSPSAAAAAVMQPIVGLSLVGAIFAAFL